MDLFPAGKAGPVIEYTCAGSSATTLVGSVIAPVSEGKMTASTVLKFAAVAGRQKPESFDGGAQDVLISVLGEQVGLKLTATQSGEEAVEVNTTV